MINNKTEECRPHRFMLSRGNLRRVVPGTDDIAKGDFLGGAGSYGSLWQFMWVYCFSTLMAFQPQFHNHPKPWDKQIGGKNINDAMILCVVW